MKREAFFFEKLAMLCVLAICVISLTVISLAALKAGNVDPNASTLIGVIAGGLIAIATAIITAIRGYSMSAQLGKVTDQLADSRPASDPVVDQVEVVNTDTKPVPTKSTK